VKLKIEKEPDSQNKLCLNLNGMNILDWFKVKFQELQIRNNPKVKDGNRLKL